MDAKIWFDGAAKGNPGPAGAGAVIVLATDAPGAAPHVVSVPMGRATNNEAEYRGLIEGAKWALQAGATRVVIRGDSQLIIKQLKGEYKVKAANLRPLYESARDVLSRFEAVRLEWVRRGENAQADAAANAALD